MNKNRKTYIIYGFGPENKIIAWDGVSKEIELLDPDALEWIKTTSLGGNA